MFWKKKKRRGAKVLSTLLDLKHRPKVWINAGKFVMQAKGGKDVVIVEAPDRHRWTFDRTRMELVEDSQGRMFVQMNMDVNIKVALTKKQAKGLITTSDDPVEFELLHYPEKYPI